MLLSFFNMFSEEFYKAYFYNGYVPQVDVACSFLCLAVFLLLSRSFTRKNLDYKLLSSMVIVLFLACNSNIIYHFFFSVRGSVPSAYIYISKLAFLLFIGAECIFYANRLFSMVKLDLKWKRIWNSIYGIFYIISILVFVITTINKTGYYIDENGDEHTGLNVFIILYNIIVFSMFAVLFLNRSKIVSNIYSGLLYVTLIATLMMFASGVMKQSSFINVSFFINILGLLYFLHRNPYNPDTGTASEEAFMFAVDDAIKNGERMLFISAVIENFSTAYNENEYIKREFNEFMKNNIKRGVIYQLHDNRFILAYKIMASTSFAMMKKDVDEIIDEFKVYYDRVKLNYKITVSGTTETIGNGSDYLKILYEKEKVMPYNTVHFIDGVDINNYKRNEYILNELRDINNKNELDDERVLVYCQPVYNVRTKKYDTAEALMRLNLENEGIIYPDKFIPIAEENDLIHTLTLIILNKVCAEVKNLIKERYVIERISVNFSILDVTRESFTDDVGRVIAKNGIPFDKIAIEVTESKTDKEFNAIRNKINELKGTGIKFYLDDFGTGYSNFERIMELPFDIIKFDRSLVVEAEKNKNADFMVRNFSNLFTDLKYSILFEGVETDDQEKLCVEMGANYIQGYKHSKPIPIERLSGFLEKM
ncbi:MAG TPA: hypothetical protein DEO62_04055 [Lachnospiraceae bacterium]|nr:hypothetical protein [Lachnospiraceae bacterium]HBR04948.1 hypothetical protein [Lachnospiraceae bacterium]HBZ90173.1 hypothetical protein [Lachnospiraceae bacterium]